jgi:hypothetical protein
MLYNIQFMAVISYIILKSMNMKKLIFLLLIMTSCSKLEFEHNSFFDYSLYNGAYVNYILDNSHAYFNITDRQDMTQYFCDELLQYSEFDYVYGQPEPGLADTNLPVDDLLIKSEITYCNYEINEQKDNEGNVTNYAEGKATVSFTVMHRYDTCNSCIIELLNDKLDGSYSRKDKGGDYYYERIEAVKDALKKISYKYFLKNLKI